jgi:origin recognition complex subunit 1
MPGREAPARAEPQLSRAKRARRLLAGVGIRREDSDDELGLEDHPWEWIYEDPSDNSAAPSEQHGPHKSSSSSSSAANGEESRTTAHDTAPSTPSSKRRAAGAAKRKLGRTIVGARMGSFQCRLGDCVLLKAEGQNEAWVGLICEFSEEQTDNGDDDEEDDDDEEEEKHSTMMANIMWFSTEKEIKNKEKKRTDFLQVKNKKFHNFPSPLLGSPFYSFLHPSLPQTARWRIDVGSNELLIEIFAFLLETE